MGWVIVLIIILVIVLWLVFGNKKKDALKTEHPAPPTKIDDLKIIEGVGPKIYEILNSAGISSFTQISQKSPDELRKILDDAGIGPIADPTSWPEQAGLAAEGKMEALKELQDRLKGGRIV